MVDKITLRELRRRLQDPAVDEADLRPYVQLDASRSQAFGPTLQINPALVDTEGLESDILLGAFNSLSRRRRQRKYRDKIRQGWTGLRIVSEGDSWLQFPILLDDVIDQLFDRYAIYSLGMAGDLLSGMISEDEITAAIAVEKPHIFLISGGGNDLVNNGRMATMVHPFMEGRDPADYLNDGFKQFLNEIAGLYGDLFSRLTTQFPELKIISHGYDWVIPAKGRWLGQPLERQGIVDARLQADILRIAIDQFNTTLTHLASQFEGRVFHVDCRGVVTDQRWFDELHPTNEGFQAVAERFIAVINTVAHADAHDPVSAESKPLSPGREARVADAEDLDPARYRQLVARRARAVIDANVGIVDNEDQRRQLEAGIAQFYEKVHKGENFLPARYLRDGAARAHAVCRISAPGGYGSGFLIASQHFIMTNNHVLPDIETARSSIAEFGFEDGSDTVTRVPLLPDQLFITDEALDYTIVACDGALLMAMTPIPLLRTPAGVTRNELVNIIQHPRGRSKEIAIHDNQVTRVKDKVIHYQTDTEPGSSGSPVFNNDWELVALHHAGWSTFGGQATNEGIRIAAIVAHLLSLQQVRSEASQGIEQILQLIPDSSHLLGFFDIDGVEPDDPEEIELPSFSGSADFADIGFWNIEHFNRRVDDQRVQQVADVLDRLSMDVMGLTEVEEPALERLVAALRERGNAVDFKLLNVRGSQDIAVLFDRETTTVELATDIADRHREALRATTAAGRLAFPRAPLFARCKVEDNTHPIEFLMIVVHLKAFGDAQSRARRQLAAKVLAEIIEDVRAQDNLPVVLGGDFNETLNTDVLSAITESPDLFSLTSDDAMTDAISYIGGRYRSLIDHVMVSRDVRLGTIAGDDAAIVRLDRSVQDFSETVSDHVPIVFRIVERPYPLDMGAL